MRRHDRATRPTRPTDRTAVHARALRTGLCLALALGAPSIGLTAQDAPPDSADLLEEMHELQGDFESFRGRRIPVENVRGRGGRCDELIGRICIWFGGEDEESFPAEFREVGQARVDLIRALLDGFEVAKDRWILGQLVHYLVEARELGEAERVSGECGIVEAWWCHALLGYTLHVRGEYVEAEAAFRDALAVMPDDERLAWTSPRYVIPRDDVERFERAPAAERERSWEMFWRLSDPLFLYEGNDRLTDHWARWVEAYNRRDAADPMGLAWGEDLEETLVRYGRHTGYSRTQDVSQLSFGTLRDNRQVVGHHHPKSRGYLFPVEFLESPSDIPPESWITAPREARTWYAPPYAPEIRGLETQVGRFRRGDEMLVVGAYRPTITAEGSDRAVSAFEADAQGAEPPHTTIFMQPVSGGRPVNVRGRDAEGVLSLLAPPGRYVASLEVVDVQNRRAWRARQGVAQAALQPGMVDVSDLMVLRSGTPLPESLSEAIPNVRPGIRLRAGERFPVVWEVYGLRIEEPLQVTVGFSRGRPGFLERVGDFLGIIEPDQPIEITFDDTGPDRVASIFRAVELELPDLDPGEYTLHLRIELTGRTPLVVSRPILVER